MRFLKSRRSIPVWALVVWLLAFLVLPPWGYRMGWQDMVEQLAERGITTQENIGLLDSTLLEEQGYFDSDNPTPSVKVRRIALTDRYFVIDYRWQPYALIIPLCEKNIEMYDLPIDEILRQIAQMESEWCK